jgi:hypothetical protein
MVNLIDKALVPQVGESALLTFTSPNWVAHITEFSSIYLFQCLTAYETLKTTLSWN